MESMNRIVSFGNVEKEKSALRNEIRSMLGYFFFLITRAIRTRNTAIDAIMVFKRKKKMKKNGSRGYRSKLLSLFLKASSNA